MYTHLSSVYNYTHSVLKYKVSKNSKFVLKLQRILDELTL